MAAEPAAHHALPAPDDLESTAAPAPVKKRCSDADEALASADAATITALIDSIKSETEDAQESATRQIRRLLHTPHTIQQAITAGLVPRLVELVEKSDHRPALQHEAAWALNNIVASDTATQAAIDHAALVAVLVRVLTNSPHEGVREQAVWALSNIAANSAPHRDLVLSLDAMTPLLRELSSSSSLSKKRQNTWAISNLCRGKPHPDIRLVRPAIAAIAPSLFSTDEEVLADTCWALDAISDGPITGIQDVVASGAVRRLVELMMHANPQVQWSAARVVGNIATGNDIETQLVISCGGLASLLSLLSSTVPHIVRDACWTISNIVAGNLSQVQAVIEANLIPPLIHLLRNRTEFSIKKECAWALANLTSSGSAEQIRYVVAQGCVAVFTELLDVGDMRIVGVVLEAIENILGSGRDDEPNPYVQAVKDADGVVRIKGLRKCDNTDVADRAEQIWDRFFGDEDEDDEDEVFVKPAVAE